MKYLISILSVFAVASVIAFSGCKKEQIDLTEEEPTVTNDSCNATFQADVLPIIRNYCATAGCHDGTQNPDLRTYGTISDDTAKIRRRALIERTMPPATAQIPSEEELNTIRCWLDAGGLNN